MKTFLAQAINIVFAMVVVISLAVVIIVMSGFNTQGPIIVDATKDQIEQNANRLLTYGLSISIIASGILALISYKASKTTTYWKWYAGLISITSLIVLSVVTFEAKQLYLSTYISSSQHELQNIERNDTITLKEKKAD